MIIPPISASSGIKLPSKKSEAAQLHSDLPIIMREITTPIVLSIIASIDNIFIGLVLVKNTHFASCNL
jgi:hypothetical protein